MSSIRIDGVDYTSESVLNYKVTYERTNDDVTTVKYNDKIVFTGQAFDLLNKAYFEQPRVHQIFEVELKGCCDAVVKLEINYRTVTKTSDCTIECTPISKIESTYDDLKKTTWYSNGFDVQNENYRQGYCVGFTFITYVLSFLYYALYAMVQALKAIEWLTGLDLGMDDFERAFHGCGRYHLAYSFREVFDYQCALLGLTFDSSILKGTTYKDLLFLPCGFEKGYVKEDERNFNKANAPAYSVLQLFKTIEPAFNAKTWLENGVLRFERVDNYETLPTADIDLDNIDATIEYSYNRSQGWAFGSFKYSQEALDSDSGEMASVFNDVVEWNKLPEKWQKGERSVTLQDYSIATFMQDMSQPKVSDKIRKNIANRERDLILSNGTSSKMKLLLWDSTISIKTDIKVKREDENPFNDATAYNRPLRFNEKEGNELYENFYKIDDPRTVAYMVGSDFDYLPDNFCIFVDKVEKLGTRIGIKSEYGIGIPESIEVDLEKGLVKIKKPRWRLLLE